MSYLDSTGYHLTPASVRLANLKATAQGIFGTGIDLSPDSPDGKWLASLAQAQADTDALLNDIYNQRAPSGATGVQLARLALINGVKKKGPQFSTGTVTLSGTVGKVFPAGSLIGNSADATAIFATDVDATIGGGGTSGPVNVTSSVAGPIAGDAGDLSVLLTVVNGITGVTNSEPVILGNDGESDDALRVRRTASVALPSQGIVDGLEASLLQVAGVTQARVRENPQDTTQTLADGGTLAPHAIQALVLGGAAADIARAIYLKRALGCTLVGSTTFNIADTQGVLHTMAWDVPSDVNIYVTVTLSTSPGPGVANAIKAAIVAWGKGLLAYDGSVLTESGTKPAYPGSQIGGAVRWAQSFIPINSIPGLDVLSVKLGTAPSPTLQADITLAYNQIATWDPSWIVVGP
jgi:uncharacterized phage protein gp47/JayE